MTGSWSARVSRAGLTLAVLLAAAAGPLLAAGAARVRAEVEPRQIAADATVLLRVIAEGRGLESVLPPSLVDLDGWSIINGPSVSTQVAYVNGVSSASRTFTWVLAPAREGSLEIGALRLEVDGAVMSTRPLTVRVTTSADKAAGAGGEQGAATPGDDVFIRAVLDPPDPYVGQRVALSYDLFTRVEVASIPQLQDVPSYPNFWMEEIDTPQRASARLERIDGFEYRVYTIRRVALFPTASGPTTLEPVTFSVPVKGRTETPFRRSFFFDPVETIYRRTLPVAMDVRPLPAAGRPADYSNAVGDFDLRVVADREQLRTGEALSLTVTVEGDGNLRSVTAPTLAGGPQFTIYPPQLRTAASGDADSNGRGRKSWEYILVPHEPGPQTVPPMAFSYFEPETGRYATLAGPLLTLDVTGTPLAEGESHGVLEQQEIRRLGSDIHYILTPRAPQAPAGLPPYRTAWFWLLLAAPPLLNLAALAYQWRRRRTQATRHLARRRRARRSALNRLRRAESGADSDDGTSFYRDLAQALTEFVADKFGGQAGGLTYDRIAALLASRQVPESGARAFLKLLEECDCARFAPSLDGAQQRGEMLQRARTALTELEAHL